MATTLYCWRCRAEVPMLDEQEWNEVSTLLLQGWQSIKGYYRAHGVGITEARRHVFDVAADRYLELTGWRESSPEAIWHHRLSLYGPPCATCGKPLRTPLAKLCAACGATKAS